MPRISESGTDGPLFSNAVTGTLMTDTKDRIKQVMSWANMTQQEFATKLKVSPASLSSIFSGRTRPTNLHIAAIHTVFPQINVNWLMFGEGGMLLASNGNSIQGSDLFGASPENDIELVQDELLSSLPTTASVPSASAAEQYEAAISPNGRSGFSRRQSVAPGTFTEGLEATRNMPQEAANNIDKPKRKVTEIRVFYNDRTYESFFPPKK